MLQRCGHQRNGQVVNKGNGAIVNVGARCKRGRKCLDVQECLFLH